MAKYYNGGSTVLGAHDFGEFPSGFANAKNKRMFRHQEVKRAKKEAFLKQLESFDPTPILITKDEYDRRFKRG